MQTHWKARGLGAVLVLASLPAFLLLAEPLGGMLAVALAVTGAFVAIVVAERVIPARAVEATVEGDAAALADIGEGLGLEGLPIYVHDQGNVGAERLFLPASANERPVPILDPDTLAYAGTGGTKVGLGFQPPGLELVRLHETESQRLPEEASLSEAEAFLVGLFATHDLARGFSVTKSGDRLRVRIEAQALELPCVVDPVEPACQKAAGCVVCQAAGCAQARSRGRPLAVEEVQVDGARVVLHLAPQQPASSREPEGQAEASQTPESEVPSTGGSPS